MIELGKMNRLKVSKRRDIGLFLDGGSYGQILLPRRYVPDEVSIGDQLDVFLYTDSEDRLIATTLTPKACAGECAYLKVVSVTRIGAFLDWGLPKDLFVPFSEQQKALQQGYSYAVFIYVDESSERLVASTRLEKHLSLDGHQLESGQAVEAMIYGKSDLGYKAILNHSYIGQFFENETFRPLHYGERLSCYIKSVRKDGKIDLTLQATSAVAKPEKLNQAILSHLQANDGVSTLTDSSPPDLIYQAFGVSKTSYKRALGQLYKQRIILIEKHQISLI